MNGQLHVDDAELHAFIDGALEASRVRAVEAALVADPALAARAAAFGADKDMLKRVYAPLIHRPVPQQWLDLARRPAARRSVRHSASWQMIGAIAAVLVLAMIGASTYWQRQMPRSGEIVQAALDARQDVTHAEQTIAVKDGGGVGRYDAALSEAVALHVKVPDLQRMGYRLAAIRLYSKSNTDKAAELVYRDGQDRLFTLYVRRSDGKARFDQFARGGLRVCVWQDDELGTVMTGNVSTAAMQRLASLTYVGLTL